MMKKERNRCKKMVLVTIYSKERPKEFLNVKVMGNWQLQILIFMIQFLLENLTGKFGKDKICKYAQLN